MRTRDGSPVASAEPFPLNHPALELKDLSLAPRGKHILLPCSLAFSPSMRVEPSVPHRCLIVSSPSASFRGSVVTLSKMVMLYTVFTPLTQKAFAEH